MKRHLNNTKGSLNFSLSQRQRPCWPGFQNESSSHMDTQGEWRNPCCLKTEHFVVLSYCEFGVVLQHWRKKQKSITLAFGGCWDKLGQGHTCCLLKIIHSIPSTPWHLRAPADGMDLVSPSTAVTKQCHSARSEHGPAWPKWLNRNIRNDPKSPLLPSNKNTKIYIMGPGTELGGSWKALHVWGPEFDAWHRHKIKVKTRFVTVTSFR